MSLGKEAYPPTIIEDVDKSLKSIDIEPASSIAKGTSNLATIRVVKWRRDPQNYPVIKEIVTNSNKDAIVLQARGKELKGSAINWLTGFAFWGVIITMLVIF